MSIKLVLYRNSNRETEWNSHASGLGTMPCFQKTDTIRPFRDFSQDHPQARPGWCATLHACSSAAPPRASLAVRCSLAAPMSEPHRLPLTAPLIVVSIELMIDAHRSMRGSDLAGADARQALGRFLPSGSQETRPPRRAMSRSSKSSSGVPSHCRFFTSLSLPGADPWMPLFRTAHPIQGATVSSSQYAKMVIVHDLTASNG